MYSGLVVTYVIVDVDLFYSRPMGFLETPFIKIILICVHCVYSEISY